MSLTDGRKKMSKSEPNDASRINVLDPPDVIRQKIKRCKTDALPGILPDPDKPDERPEATNLVNIYLAVQPPDRSRADALEELATIQNWGDFKPLLADAIIAHLEPIQTRYHEIRRDDAHLRRVLADGAASARAVANRTLHATRVAMGFVVADDEVPKKRRRRRRSNM